jgi:hypothetical protein
MLSLLRIVFGFDKWHAAAPYCCRAYKQAVVALANESRPSVVVEVGCGLGDIISRVSASERVGIDSDRRVIRAARFMHRTGRWDQGSVDAVATAVTPSRRIDCLIMVNWIHTLSPEELAAAILPLIVRIRYLIVDAIDPDGPSSYRFKHDFSFLAGRARQVKSIRVAVEPRTFMIFESLS